MLYTGRSVANGSYTYIMRTLGIDRISINKTIKKKKKTIINKTRIKQSNNQPATTYDSAVTIFLFKNNVCTLQNAFNPFAPHSVPIPLSLCPPNGAMGVRSKCVLIQMLPACSWRATREALLRSLVQTEAPRPMLVLLARSMTSSSVVKVRRGTMGPGQTR